MSLDTSYRNPFAEYNANKMDSTTVLDYWCDPFLFRKSKAVQSGSFSEVDILRHTMPMFFVGGRGTGKTMFLKYFSYPVQIANAEREKGKGSVASLHEYLLAKGAIGLYLRVDGPLLRSFTGNGLTQDKWNAIFAHYFELRVCQAVLDVLKDLVQRDVLPASAFGDTFLQAAGRVLALSLPAPSSLDALIDAINTDLETVTRFRSDIVFSDVDFQPRKAFASGDLLKLVQLARSHSPNVLGKIIFPILLDEYENYSVEQQRQINTLVKFVPDGLTFRIGMRFQGFHTYDTVTTSEFIKKGRDYQEIVFEEVLIRDMDYEKFLIGVSRKRLEAVPLLRDKGFVDIVQILGDRANLEEEARQLVAQRKTPTLHFGLLKRANIEATVEEAQQLLQYPDNPLLEMLNILWVLRGRKPLEVRSAMQGYLAGESSEKAAKYRMDYVDKYKLSLMFLLCSIYRQNKKYYSFNTFCYLSSGIVGNFIELCRRSFQSAYFDDRETLLEEGRIGAGIQDVAAKEVSASELQMVTRIHRYGEMLYRFVCNIGNIFRAYHTDVRLKYCETNQFSIDPGSVGDENLHGAFDAAVEWSLVQRKPRLQSTSPNSPRRIIYTLNRIFSPAFEITYRTRGQYSEEYTEADLRRLMMEDGVPAKLGRNEATDGKDAQQELSL